MTDFDHLAPYPTSAEEATADRLARLYAVAAQRSYRKIMAVPGTADIDDHIRFVDQWSVVHLLRALQAAAPDKADEHALDLWECWEDGSGFGEWLWEWLTEYGIDPDQITAPKPDIPTTWSVPAEPTGVTEVFDRDGGHWLRPDRPGSNLWWRGQLGAGVGYEWHELLLKRGPLRAAEVEQAVSR